MSSESEQFGRIYDEYVGKIYRFVYLKVSSEDVAQDITSKVFAKGWEAYQRSGQYIENVRAFLYRIARNAVIDTYREKDKASFASLEASKEVLAAPVDLHQSAMLHEDVQLVKNAIGNLAKDHQDAILLHYLDDMSVTEIAQVMDKTPGAVRTMLHRGLKALRAELQIEEA